MYDVVVLGGGPAGATCAALLRTYSPHLSVFVAERDVFPRDHVGESQLPGCAQICAEMGCWDKVEAAGFPVKLGASYTWGRDREQWDFDFVFPAHYTDDLQRPASFEGVRRQTAFHVDRAVYDKVLLDHAQELGATVVQGCGTKQVHRAGDRVTGVTLADGRRVGARYYVDATGSAGAVRRAMGIATQAPEALRNIAIWGYWSNAKWAYAQGVDGTRIHIHSLPYGWIWYIPLGPDRTSVGLVMHADYYKNTGKTKEELYRAALSEHELVSSLLMDASLEKDAVNATSDWSYTADRLVGENWFLIGEAAGFADPILSAGMLNAHRSGQDCAATIGEIERAELDPLWLRARFDKKHRENIQQYIRFAQFWYAANGCFTDLKKECAAIAREGGVTLSPEHAWGWLSFGGFALDDPLQPSVGAFDVQSARDITYAFLGDTPMESFERYNTFTLNTDGAERDTLGKVSRGRIKPVPCLRRGKATLPLDGYFGTMHQLLSQTDDVMVIIASLLRQFRDLTREESDRTFQQYVATLEAMIQDGWVIPAADPGRQFVKRPRVENDSGRFIVSNPG